MVIVCIGDSITYGQHLPPEAKSWPRLLDGEVLAYGVPGDTTRLGLERFPECVQKLAMPGDTVVIQFGHNDANRWDTDRGLPRVSLAAYKANLVEMIERVRTFGATPFLCSITPTTRSAHFAADCEIYDRVLRRVAADEGVTLIDVREAFRDFAHQIGAPLLMDDGLHLNEDGHALYADTVGAALA